MGLCSFPTEKTSTNGWQPTVSLLWNLVEQHTTLVTFLTRFSLIVANTAVDFFNEISLIWGIVCELGIPKCPEGEGFPQGFEYRWADEKMTSPIRCSGPHYVDYVLTWVEEKLNDGVSFPSSTGKNCLWRTFCRRARHASDVTLTWNEFIFAAAPFPRNFMTSLRSVYARLFRIFAIVYTNHLPVLEELGALSHLNTSFKHYVIFCWEFDLLKSCEEDALRDLIDEIRRRHLSRK